jgi:hypothetical protein
MRHRPLDARPCWTESLFCLVNCPARHPWFLCGTRLTLSSAHAGEAVTVPADTPPRFHSPRPRPWSLTFTPKSHGPHPASDSGVSQLAAILPLAESSSSKIYSVPAIPPSTPFSRGDSGIIGCDRRPGDVPALPEVPG